jgi:hemerythrin
MNTAFQWDDSYSVKVGAMDDQHKQLFDIVRELYIAMHSGKGRHVAGDVLTRLIDYTEHHFAAEEAIMEKNHYPDLARHRVEHRDLENKVRAFKQDFEAGTGAITIELMTFLQDWLTNHIQNVDQKYGDYLNSKGVH